MQGIQPLWDQMPLFTPSTAQTERPARGVVSPFTDIFQTAVQAVRETDAERVQTEYLLATGQLDNPALSTIAATKAQTSIDLLVQLRNRALDAYNELMRISL